ncbi:MAG: transporter [Gemmatimonadales bacterium]
MEPASGTGVTQFVRAAAAALFLCGAMAPTLPAQADPGPINTDRPGPGYSTATLPAGVVQLEMSVPGVSSTDVGAGTERTISFPSLIRIGVLPGLEARIGSPIYSSTRVTSNQVATTTDGVGGLELGAKLRVNPGGGTGLVFIPSITLPLGDDAVTDDRAGFTLLGVASWSWASGIGLTTVVGGALSPNGDGARDLSGNLAAIVSRPLGGSVSGYVDLGWLPTEGATNALFAGGGLLWRVHHTVQLDAFVDRGLNHGATDWVFGAGIAVRP